MITDCDPNHDLALVPLFVLPVALLFDDELALVSLSPCEWISWIESLEGLS